MRLYLSSFRLGNKPEALLEMLKGSKRTALIGNAMDFVDEQQRKVSMTSEVERLKSIGLEPTEIDLRDYFGTTDDLRKVLGGFDLLWVRGGNSFILRRAFQQSGADEIVKALLADNAVVYGGYSAGTIMLCPSLHGIELVDPPNEVPEGYDNPIIWDCLNIIPYSIAPHYKSNHPESVDIDKSVEYFEKNNMPYKALRDGQVIVVDGSKEEILR